LGELQITSFYWLQLWLSPQSEAVSGRTDCRSSIFRGQYRRTIGLL